MSRVTPSGNLIPFADPPYYQGQYSPYFNETHYALRDEVRDFVDQFIVPFVDEWDASGTIDPQLYLEFGKRGYLCATTGPVYPAEYSDIRLKSVPPERFDAFHEMIVIDEICRAGSGAVAWFLVGGFNISVPAILKFAPEELKRKVLPDILSGKRRCCLAITEPDAGSDVANLTTTATKSVDGKTYLLEGTKKWITNGVFSDYFVVAARTGKSGMNGISVLLVERSMGDVSTRKILTQGMNGSGTTLLNFDDVPVPCTNILGTENNGFKVIMSNFNHERLAIIAQAVRLARCCIEDSMKWAHERETFGQKLISHAVIRNKLGTMGGRVEALQSRLNDLVFQTKMMTPAESAQSLGGPIAACKAYATQTLELCAREASQIFGGLAYTRGGKGGRVERIYRDVRAFAIPGGSEEIMLDLGVRQSLRDNVRLGLKL